MKTSKTSLVICLLITFFCFKNYAQVKVDSAIKAKQNVPFSEFKEPKILSIKVQRLNEDDSLEAQGKIPIIYPNGMIKVRVSNPYYLLITRPSDTSDLILYVNGVPLKGMQTKWFTSYTNMDLLKNPKQISDILKNPTEIQFVIKRDMSTKADWDFFYQNTPKWYKNYITLNLSVGWDGLSPLAKDGNGNTKVIVKYFRNQQFIVWVVGFTVFLLFALYLSIYTDLLKESGKPDGAYSLSLSQLMFWTVLVIAAFIYSLVLTDIANTLNDSVLLLLGISISTTGVASFIDLKKKTADNLESKTHQNFFRDILTDGNSYSVQRTQIVAWNLVLGIYFIFYTINNKDMPEFSYTLLFLAGVSSASYLTGKIPENKTSDTKNTANSGDNSVG